MKTIRNLKRVLEPGARQGLVLIVCGAMLGACGNYQAPVTEASERQVIVPPEIVTSSQGDASRRSTTGGVTTTSTTQGARATTGSTGSSATRSGSSASVHRVRPGETLFSIAFEHDLDFRSLAIANNLRPPYTIFVDQELRLDVSTINAAGSGGNTTSANPAVTDTGVVRTRAGGGIGGVFRQPIGSQSTPSWQWPHRGAIVRAFAVDGNEGLDIGGQTGDPVLAAGAGDVVYSGRGVQGIGNLIIIRHNDRFLSAYGHNSTMLVSEGEHVEAGQQIGAVGENAAGIPMLHFEIREEGKSVDPSTLLP